MKFVVNLWTALTALHSEALPKNGKEPHNSNKLLVAATFEKAKLSFSPCFRIITSKVGSLIPQYPTLMRTQLESMTL